MSHLLSLDNDYGPLQCLSRLYFRWIRFSANIKKKKRNENIYYKFYSHA